MSAYATSLRSALGGTLRASDTGTHVRLGGWVHRTRNLGGLVFVDLRDRSGLLQLSFGPDWTDARSLEAVRGLGPETVIAVEGKIERREKALLARGREETGNDTVKLQGKNANIEGLAVADMTKDQREGVRAVMRDLLAPFRKEDADEAMKFVEDAARLLYREFDGDKRIADFRIACSHLESLHSHDAVSVICKGVKDGFSADFMDFGSLLC